MTICKFFFLILLTLRRKDLGLPSGPFLNQPIRLEAVTAITINKRSIMVSTKTVLITDETEGHLGTLSCTEVHSSFYAVQKKGLTLC